MIRISSYLHKSRHNIYYFRVVFPKMTGGNAGREIRVSLKTKNLSEAAKYSGVLRLVSERLFRQLSMGEIDWKELKSLLIQTLKQSFKRFSDDIENNGPKPEYSEEIWRGQVNNWKQNIVEIGELELELELIWDKSPSTQMEIPEKLQLISTNSTFLSSNFEWKLNILYGCLILILYFSITYDLMEKLIIQNYF